MSFLQSAADDDNSMDASDVKALEETVHAMSQMSMPTVAEALARNAKLNRAADMAQHQRMLRMPLVFSLSDFKTDENGVIRYTKPVAVKVKRVSNASMDTPYTEGDVICLICQDNRRAVAYHPCGHFYACHACFAKDNAECNICGGRIDDHLVVIVS